MGEVYGNIINIKISRIGCIYSDFLGFRIIDVWNSDCM